MEITPAQEAVLVAIIESAKTLTASDPGWVAESKDKFGNVDNSRVSDSTKLRPVSLAMVSIANLRLWGHDPATITELEKMELIQRWCPTNEEIASVLVRWAPPGGDAVTLSPMGAHLFRLTIAEHIETVKILEPDHDPSEGRWATVERTYPSEVPEWVPNGKLRQNKMPRYVREHRLPKPNNVADKAKSPVDQAIAAEEFLMQDAIKEDGRPDLDPETGKPKRQVVTLWKAPVPRAKPKKRSKPALQAGVAAKPVAPTATTTPKPPKPKPSRPTPASGTLGGGLGSSPLPAGDADRGWAVANAEAEKAAKGRKGRRRRGK